MTRFFAIFLLLVAVARAEEVTFDEVCAVTLPSNERWQRSYGQKIAEGDLVFNATRADKGQFFAVCALRNVPSDDLDAPSVTSWVLETMKTLGSKSGAPEAFELNGIKYLQFVGNRSESGMNYVAVARATKRGRNVYLLITIGQTVDNPAADKQFTRVMDTFHYVEPAMDALPVGANPLFWKYRLGAIVCGGTAAFLMVVFGIAMLVTHRRHVPQ